jgi:hypothetical protein
MVGDGHPMGVASQVVEHLFRACKRPLFSNHSRFISSSKSSSKPRCHPISQLKTDTCTRLLFRGVRRLNLISRNLIFFRDGCITSGHIALPPVIIPHIAAFPGPRIYAAISPGHPVDHNGFELKPIFGTFLRRRIGQGRSRPPAPHREGEHHNKGDSKNENGTMGSICHRAHSRPAWPSGLLREISH